MLNLGVYCYISCPVGRSSALVAQYLGPNNSSLTRFCTSFPLQVDAVLEALHVVRSNTPAVSTSGAAQQDSSAHSAGGEDPAEGTPGTPTASRGAPIEPKVLDFLSPVPSGHRPRTSLHGAPSQRYSPVESGPYEDEVGCLAGTCVGHVCTYFLRIAMHSRRQAK